MECHFCREYKTVPWKNKVDANLQIFLALGKHWGSRCHHWLSTNWHGSTQHCCRGCPATINVAHRVWAPAGTFLRHRGSSFGRWVFCQISVLHGDPLRTHQERFGEREAMKKNTRGRRGSRAAAFSTSLQLEQSVTWSAAQGLACRKGDTWD